MQSVDSIARYPSFSRGWWRAKALKLFRFLIHPITIFVGLQAICIAIAVMWVIWFVDQNQAIEQVNNTFTQFQWDNTFGLTLLIVGCVLLGMLLVGTIFLFVFVQKQSSLIRRQRNFVSSVTHELRSPLASLQLAFETLKSKKDMPEDVLSQMYSMAGSDIDRLSRLVEQILISARLDRGLHSGDKVEKFPVLSVIADAMDRVEHVDPNAKTRIEVTGEPDITMDGQKAVVSLVLSNLLENALKYSPEKSTVRIDFGLEDSLVRISVKDQGFGLSKKDRRKVFKMFHRAEVASKQAIPGTGLGLYIVKTMVDNCGGKIAADSDGHDKGSTFTIHLPKNHSTVPVQKEKA